MKIIHTEGIGVSIGVADDRNSQIASIYSIHEGSFLNKKEWIWSTFWIKKEENS